MTIQTIFFDGTFLTNNAGIGRDARNLLEVLKSEFAWDVKIIYPKRRLISRKVKISSKPVSSILLQRLYSFRVAVTQKPDILNLPAGCIFIQPHLYGVVPENQKEIQYIIRLHDLFPISNPEWFRFYSNRIFETSLRTSLIYGRFLCDSQATQSALRTISEIAWSRSQVAYCPVRRLMSIPCNKCFACQNFLTPKSYLIAVGTIEPRKNHYGLVEAWVHVLPSLEANSALVIVGKKGWKSGRTTRKILSLKHSRVLWLQDVCDKGLNFLLANAQSLVSTSFEEGFNLPVAEALMAGTPVLISNNSVHKEIYNGFANFFDLNSKDSLTQGIVESFQTPGVSNREILSAKFNFDENMKILAKKMNLLIYQGTTNQKIED